MNPKKFKIEREILNRDNKHRGCVELYQSIYQGCYGAGTFWWLREGPSREGSLPVYAGTFLNVCWLLHAKTSRNAGIAILFCKLYTIYMVGKIVGLMANKVKTKILAPIFSLFRLPLNLTKIFRRCITIIVCVLYLHPATLFLHI
jgi:hypothetical protein